MRRVLRQLFDKLFTTAAGLSVLAMTAALVVILGPIFFRGATAVVFSGTVEFRKLQFHEPMFNRGDRQELAEEVRRTSEARDRVFAVLDRFSRGIDVEPLIDQVKQIDRRFETELIDLEHTRNLTRERSRELDRASRRLRRYLTKALETTDADTARRYLDRALEYADDETLAPTVAADYFPLARKYRRIVDDVDLTLRDKYAEPLAELKDLIYRLFGPRPGENPKADLAQFRYGATRLDQATELRHRILIAEVWKVNPQTRLREMTEAPRARQFDGRLDELFATIGDDEQFDRMMNPEFTFYWQYFIDDSTPGHYFGGVGPEIVGTLLLTVLTVLFAVPVGIITAAYLVEQAGDNVFIRGIRMCINTLAGVPSIVFGLFGLAFFLMKVQPALGLARDISIFAGALTLAVLSLPIIIRASEEAIRAVPQSYREASLSLGAGGLRTFVVVTLPAAMPGVLTGIILAMSRAAGETAAILFVVAVAVGKGFPDSIFRGGARVLSYGAYDLAKNDRLAAEVPHNQFGMTMTLVLLVLLLNVAAILLRSRMSKKLRG